MGNFDKIFEETCKNAYEGVLYGEANGERFNIQYGIDLDKKIPLGGVTKLFTLTCILRLIENKKLILDTKISTYLTEDEMKGLCVYKGTDYTKDITIRDLMFQKSGLCDYFNAIVKPQISRCDVRFTFDDKLIWTKEASAVGKPGKASYNSTLNTDILVKIVEKSTGKNIIDVYKEFIFSPLNFKCTYVPTDEKKYIPALYYEGKPLRRNSLIMSGYGSAGLVSTPRELMKFIKAFFNGWLFDEELIKKLLDFSSIENSIPNTLYGGGLMKIKSKKQILGLMGYTGAFAFADPDRKVYFVGYVAEDGIQTILPKMLAEVFERA
jgi:CubicO group peptidase (beta-lactamase class C family)